jgi:hypothetical protein
MRTLSVVLLLSGALAVVGCSGADGTNGTAGATGGTGAMGSPGAAGAGGPAGASGDTGATGATGSTGATGAAGPAGGPTGDAGPAGPAGDAGPPGAGVEWTDATGKVVPVISATPNGLDYTLQVADAQGSIWSTDAELASVSALAQTGEIFAAANCAGPVYTTGSLLPGETVTVAAAGTPAATYVRTTTSQNSTITVGSFYFGGACCEGSKGGDGDAGFTCGIGFVAPSTTVAVASLTAVTIPAASSFGTAPIHPVYVP